MGWIIDGGFRSHDSAGSTEVVLRILDQDHRLVFDQEVVNTLVGDLCATIASSTYISYGWGDRGNLHTERIVHLEGLVAVEGLLQVVEDVIDVAGLVSPLTHGHPIAAVGTGTQTFRKHVEVQTVVVWDAIVV